MIKNDDEKQNEIYSFWPEKEGILPFFLNSPHSGEEFYGFFLEESALTREELLSISDLFVTDLIEPLREAGWPLLSARFPRSMVDLNRSPLELDPLLIAGDLPANALTQTPRIRAGLGVVPRLLNEKTPIHKTKIPIEKVNGRITQFYRPYHEKLAAELAIRHQKHGKVLLLDFHSMPSSLGAYSLDKSNKKLPDIVLGDRFGASCDHHYIDALETCLQRAGFSVTRNLPYAGGYITEHYGKPHLGWHAIQIEINRALYMDEKNLTRSASAKTFSEAFSSLISDFLFRELGADHTS